MLLEVAAEDEGVRGGEGAGAAAQRQARRVLQLLVQVQVAALLAPVVVAQAVSAHVGLQRGLVGPQSLADAAAVLQLPVRPEVALQRRWTMGAVDAERTPGQRKTRGGRGS